MRVFRAKYTAKPPAGAERLTKGGRTLVRWRGRGGVIEGELLPTGRVRVVVTDVWWMEWRGPQGEKLRERGYSDKAATEAECRRRQTAADRQAAGLDAPADPVKAGRPVAEHLADYAAWLTAKGRSPKHVAQTAARVRRVLAGVGAVKAGDVTEEAVTLFVASLKRGTDGVGQRTANGYATETRAFLGWLKRTKRAVENPLADLVAERDGSDVRRRRRRLTDAEFDRLVERAAKSKPRARRVNARPHGEARAVLYLVAAYTGYRAEEIGGLTPDHFTLDDVPPLVCVSGADTKGGREGVIPLAPAVVPRVRAFLAGKPAGKRLWPGAWWKKAAQLLAEDLAACDPPIPYRDSRGRYADFHSLRRTFVSRLAAAGTPLKTAQKLARHTSAALTWDVYAEEAELREMAAAVANLPAPPADPVRLPSTCPGRPPGGAVSPGFSGPASTSPAAAGGGREPTKPPEITGIPGGSGSGQGGT